MSYSKFRAKPTTIDGRRFDSKKEARKYVELKFLKASGKIVDFECQAPFRISVNNELICTYWADFVTYTPDGVRHILDVKGVKTPVYRLKKKLMQVVLGLTIEEC
jgi:hypothetical protein